MAKKSWKQKLEGAPDPHVVVLEKPFVGLAAGARLFIASPRLVRDFMAAIEPGRTATLVEMRSAFARQHEADGACPLSTSIFARVAAEAALDELKDGKQPSEITPFWRLIDEKSPIAKKLSCGVEFITHQRLLEARA